MNTNMAFAILPFLAAAECHVLAQYFDDPKVGEYDVPVNRNYRQAFREKNQTFLTYGRVLRILRKGFFEDHQYGNGKETSRIECIEPFDCTQKLNKEMDLIVDQLVMRTADQFDTLMDKYVIQSLKLLNTYEEYVFTIPEKLRTDSWIQAPFDYMKFQGPQKSLLCGLLFLFDGNSEKIDEIYRKYAFFANDREGKTSSSLAELRSSMRLLSNAERVKREYERFSDSSADGEQKNGAEPTNPGDGDDIQSDAGMQMSIIDRFFYSSELSSQEAGLRDLEEDMIQFMRPFCENTDKRSLHVLKWSFLKKWPFYEEGFFMKKSLEKHGAILGRKRISLKIVFDGLEFEHSFEGIMAASELVPFILHNYIVDVALHLILFAIRANNRLLRFLTREDPDISKEKRPKSHVFLNKNEDTYYKYFGRQITIFRLAYKHYCQVMKHDDTLIVNLLDSITKLYNGMATNVEIIEKNIVELKVVLTSRFKWSKANVDKVEDMEISIEGLVDVMERINFRFFGLTEFIIDSKI